MYEPWKPWSCSTVRHCQSTWLTVSNSNGKTLEYKLSKKNTPCSFFLSNISSSRSPSKFVSSVDSRIASVCAYCASKSRLSAAKMVESSLIVSVRGFLVMKPLSGDESKIYKITEQPTSQHTIKSYELAQANQCT